MSVTKQVTHFIINEHNGGYDIAADATSEAQAEEVLRDILDGDTSDGGRFYIARVSHMVRPTIVKMVQRKERDLRRKHEDLETLEEYVDESAAETEESTDQNEVQDGATTSQEVPQGAKVEQEKAAV